ncbi:MAG: PrsW family glutamic-type intramembrane protease [Candidatus Bathyarchaeota archaeon]
MTSRDNEVVIVIHRPGLIEKLFFFASGIVMSIPLTLLAEQLSFSLVDIRFPEFYATLLSVAVIAPFIEEFAKAYPLFYRHGETEKSIFILGFLAGLGFGIAEFLTYIFVYSAPILKRLPVMLFHATNSSITAYGIATKKSFKFYLTAVALHFLLNFSAQFNSFWSVGAAITLTASYYISWHLHGKTKEKIVV